MRCVWCTAEVGDGLDLEKHSLNCFSVLKAKELDTLGSLLPPDQGKRDKFRPRYDLIPKEFLDEIVSIFEEGRKPRPNLPEGYGDSWKLGGVDFLRDCLNHAQDHLLRAQRGDTDENHLSKVAWNVLVVKWHQLQNK